MFWSSHFIKKRYMVVLAVAALLCVICFTAPTQLEPSHQFQNKVTIESKSKKLQPRLSNARVAELASLLKSDRYPQDEIFEEIRRDSTLATVTWTTATIESLEVAGDFERAHDLSMLLAQMFGDDAILAVQDFYRHSVKLSSHSLAVHGATRALAMSRTESSLSLLLSKCEASNDYEECAFVFQLIEDNPFLNAKSELFRQFNTSNNSDLKMFIVGALRSYQDSSVQAFLEEVAINENAKSELGRQAREVLMSIRSQPSISGQ